jgi:hypothetical protein
VEICNIMVRGGVVRFTPKLNSAGECEKLNLVYRYGTSKHTQAEGSTVPYSDEGSESVIA